MENTTETKNCIYQGNTDEELTVERIYGGSLYLT